MKQVAYFPHCATQIILKFTTEDTLLFLIVVHCKALSQLFSHIIYIFFHSSADFKTRHFALTFQGKTDTHSSSL